MRETLYFGFLIIWYRTINHFQSNGCRTACAIVSLCFSTVEQHTQSYGNFTRRRFDLNFSEVDVQNYLKEFTHRLTRM